MSLGQHAPRYGLQSKPIFWFIRSTRARLSTSTGFFNRGDVEGLIQ